MGDRDIKAGQLLCPVCIHIVKSVNKVHPRERQHMVFIHKRSLFRGFFALFYQESMLKYDLYLQGVHYLEVTLNTGLTVVSISLQN